MSKDILKLGLPKGSLEESTYRMFKKAGFQITASSRSYFPMVDDPQISPMLIRAQEMARYVEDGVLDAGLTGRDWVLEQGAKVVEVAELRYAKAGLKPVRWVLAVPNDSKIQKVKDLEGKRIATELVGYTKKYLKQNGVNAIVEFTETGSSLHANNLRVVDTLLESNTLFIANKQSWEDSFKRKKIENIVMLLQGAITAEEKVGLKMNVESKNLKKLLNVLPALQTPTLGSLSDAGWQSVEVIVDEKIVRDIVPQLKEAGASGIVEYPLNKVIY